MKKWIELVLTINNIAIIGCQSSGKSTLLNILFNTDFEELNQKDRGMAQTTKGIWVAWNEDKDILVFDIEGTDSRERGDDRMTFEQTTSLFALAIADVLIINLWTTDVGRYAASNYGLLKVIFEVNLKLFSQNQSHKKLVFVLRDFNKHENNEESITNLLENNVKTIWNEIYKDDKFENSTPHDFFDFEYWMLPHKIYQPDDFTQAGLELRARFKVDHPNSLFPDIESKSVPIDGLSMYIENCWKCIREQKELNLPGEKQMVATYRCGEIKQEAIGIVSEKLNDLDAKTTEGIVEEFEDEWNFVLSAAYEYYDDSAKQYYEETYKSVREELTDHLISSLFRFFNSQLKHLILQADQKFMKVLKTSFSEDSVADNFTDIVQNAYDQIMKSFKESANMLMISKSNWGSSVELYMKDLSNTLIKMIEHERNRQKEKLFQFSYEDICDELETVIQAPIANLEDDFWTLVKEGYNKVILSKEENVKIILNDGFKTLEDEYDKFITDLEAKIYHNSVKVIIKVASDLNSHLNRKFNMFFKKDSNEKNRNWKDIEEDDIRKLHDDCLKQFDDIYDQFRKIEIPVHVSNPEPEMLTSSFTKKKAALLSQEDLIKIRDKFEDDCAHALEEAIRLHHNIFNSGVPIYFWALFIFFAYDDIFRWLASPFLFYPIVFLLTLAGLLQSLGLLMPVIQASRVMIRMGYAQIQAARK